MKQALTQNGVFAVLVFTLPILSIFPFLIHPAQSVTAKVTLWNGVGQTGASRSYDQIGQPYLANDGYDNMAKSVNNSFGGWMILSEAGCNGDCFGYMEAWWSSFSYKKDLVYPDKGSCVRPFGSTGDISVSAITLYRCKNLMGQDQITTSSQSSLNFVAQSCIVTKGNWRICSGPTTCYCITTTSSNPVVFVKDTSVAPYNMMSVTSVQKGCYVCHVITKSTFKIQ